MDVKLDEVVDGNTEEYHYHHMNYRGVYHCCMEGSSQMNRRSVEQRVKLKGLHTAFDLSLLDAEHAQ
jgi:hypothetical protein